MRVENVSCNNCGALGLEHFYALENIPVHSTILMPSAEEATSYPTGDLKLGFCEKCGFVENFVFDPSVHEYSTKCEESQHFSQRFMTFLRELTQDLIDKHDIKNKQVLEIGCGKGEFLELLCEMGNNSGVGIDPGYMPERLKSEAASRIEFIQDFYSERYAHLTGDVVCCRHTLEHIAPTRSFLQLVRRTIGDKGSLVFFEVPDVERVIAEPAFWDIYYEHCSYFSLASLGHLFRSTGFEILELYKAFEDQYLIIVAKPGDASLEPSFPGEDHLERLTGQVKTFVEEAEATGKRWKELLAARKAEGKKVVVWGSSSKGVSFLTSLGIGDEVGYVVDINTYRQNKFMPGSGHEIVAPERMRDYQPDTVIAMNPIYTEEIRTQLAGMGVEPEMLAV